MQTTMFEKWMSTGNEKTTIIIRVMVGGVLLSEGIQEFLYPGMRGLGCFEGMAGSEKILEEAR